MDFKRYENEKDDELIYRVCSQKESIGRWCDVRDVLNELLGYDYTDSAYRKKYQYFTKLLEANNNKFVDSEAQLEEINYQKRELEKLKKQIQTEKVEYNKWLREDARDELIGEKIINAINTLPSLNVPNHKIKNNQNQKSYVLCLGDEHLGVEFEIKGLFGEVLNSYSPEVFESRMWKLRDKIIEIVKKENINLLKIYDLGDNIDGLLRVSQLCKLRYGVLEQTMQFAEFISNWLNEISQHVCIDYRMIIDANHSQLRMLGQQKNTFTDENLSKVILKFIQERLKNNAYITINTNPTGMIYDDVCGYKILAIHGEVKSMERALDEFKKVYGVNIDYLLAGHLHHSKSEEVGFSSEVINIPSIIGIDDYSLSLRKVSNSAAKLLVFEENEGKTIEYTIKLN